MWISLAAVQISFLLLFQPRWFDQKHSLWLALLLGALVTTLSWRWFDWDPFAAMLWGCFVILTCYFARKFYQWTLAQTATQDAILDSSRFRFSTLLGENEKRQEGIDRLNQEVYIISHLYEQARRMSECLDTLHLFWVFKEELCDDFLFESVRLLLVELDESNQARVTHAYEYRVHDTEPDLKEPREITLMEKRYESAAVPFDQQMIHLMQKTRQGVNVLRAADEPSLVASPLFIEKELKVVIAVRGIPPENYSRFSILNERFLSEMKRVKLYERVQRLAITDGLTGAFVRRHFVERLDEESSRSERFELSFSVLMIDIDNFKQFNDSHGHLVGDAILKTVTNLIKSSVREVDLVGRYGGEEFVVLLPETSKQTAAVVAERIRMSIFQHRMKAYDEELCISVSIGVANYPSHHATGQALVEKADQMMYEAKRQGKNRTFLDEIQGSGQNFF